MPIAGRVLCRHSKQWIAVCCGIVQSLELLDLEETKKDLINREIRSFRDAHKVRLIGLSNPILFELHR